MLGFLLAGLGVLFGIGRMEVQKFEYLAAQEIGSRLEGESKKVSVQTKLNGIIAGPLGDLKQVTIKASDFSVEGIPLFTQPELSKRGVIRDLRIELSNFTLAGLRVEELSASIPDCRFDYARAIAKKEIRLSKSGLGAGKVRVLEKDLEAFVLKKVREIKRVTVKIEKDKVFVDGYGEFLILTTNFSVIARLEAVNGVKLYLSHADIHFDGRPADELAAKVLMDTLNPVVDLDEDLHLHGAVYVRGIRLQDGVLEAWGDTKIPNEPKAAGLMERLNVHSPWRLEPLPSRRG